MGQYGLQPNVISFNAAMAALPGTEDDDLDAVGGGGGGGGSHWGGSTVGGSTVGDPGMSAAGAQLAAADETHGPQPDAITGTALNACAKARDLETAESLFADLGREGRPPPDTPCYNALLLTCARCGAWERALQVERSMGSGVERAGAGAAEEGGRAPTAAPICEISSYTILMQCLRRRRVREGFALLDRLPQAQLPKSFPVHNMLREACRAQDDTAGVADVNARIEALGLTNISPEALFTVTDEHGKQKGHAHLWVSFAGGASHGQSAG